MANAPAMMLSTRFYGMIMLRSSITAINARFLPIMALSVAFAFSALAEPPVKLDCTIRYWNDALKKQMEHDLFITPREQQWYSTTKVAPKDIAWLRPGVNPVGRRTHGFIVLGSCKKGNLTDSTDIRDLLIKLSKVASDHGANAVSHEKSGTEIRFQFLRMHDSIVNAAKRQNNMKESQ